MMTASSRIRRRAAAKWTWRNEVYEKYRWQTEGECPMMSSTGKPCVQGKRHGGPHKVAKA